MSKWSNRSRANAQHKNEIVQAFDESIPFFLEWINFEHSNPQPEGDPEFNMHKARSIRMIIAFLYKRHMQHEYLQIVCRNHSQILSRVRNVCGFVLCSGRSSDSITRVIDFLTGHLGSNKEDNKIGEKKINNNSKPLFHQITPQVARAEASKSSRWAGKAPFFSLPLFLTHTRTGHGRKRK